MGADMYWIVKSEKYAILGVKTYKSWNVAFLTISEVIFFAEILIFLNERGQKMACFMGKSDIFWEIFFGSTFLKNPILAAEVGIFCVKNDLLQHCQKSQKRRKSA